MLKQIFAIPVIKARTGVSSKVYAQHDLGSEIILVSTNFAEELGLVSEGSSKIAVHTMSESTVSDFNITHLLLRRRTQVSDPNLEGPSHAHMVK